MSNRQLLISTAANTISAARRDGMIPHNHVNNWVVLEHLDRARSTHKHLRPYWRSLTEKQQRLIMSAVYRQIP